MIFADCFFLSIILEDLCDISVTFNNNKVHFSYEI